jgi:hypothetical protein
MPPHSHLTIRRPRFMHNPPSTWKRYLGAAPYSRTHPRRSVPRLEKNPVVSTLTPSPPCGRLPHRKRALLGRLNVRDSLRRRLEHPAGGLHHPGGFFISRENCGMFGVGPVPRFRFEPRPWFFIKADCKGFVVGLGQSRFPSIILF